MTARSQHLAMPHVHNTCAATFLKRDGMSNGRESGSNFWQAKSISLTAGGLVGSMHSVSLHAKN